MRMLLSIVIAGLWAAPAAAQTCTPTPVQTLAWGAPGQDIVPAYADKTTNLVPAGEVWLIKAAGVGQGVDPGTALEYRLQIDHQWADQSYWYTAVEVVTPQRGTPVIALTRPVILEQGERLSARSNSMPNGGTMYVQALGWRFSADCLGRLLGTDGMSGTATNAAPDYGPFMAAAQAAANKLTESATALTTLAGSAP
jgi:hypothetical protein